jgi:hypothetical protein
MDPVRSISRRILNLSGWTFSNCTRSSTPPASAEVGLRIGCTVGDPVVIRALASMLTASGTGSAAFLDPCAEIEQSSVSYVRDVAVASLVCAAERLFGVGERALLFE